MPVGLPVLVFDGDSSLQAMKLHVVADDRTGAFETAAALADRGAGPVPVIAWPTNPPIDCHVVVVDLGSRHLAAVDARDRAAGLDQVGPMAHKIDSTLRGNWAEELTGRHQSTGRPILLIPALPALGRTCIGGTVFDHGRPVHEGNAGIDARRPVATSRPADMLHASGANDVRNLADLDDVRDWLGSPAGVAVVDADSQSTIDTIVSEWARRPDVLLAGTSVVIGSAASQLAAPKATMTTLPSIGDGPVLVACGSLHPIARAQVERARRLGGAHVFVATPVPLGAVYDQNAVAAAHQLAADVTVLMERTRFAALVVLGGDTVAAIVGNATVIVHGSIAPGTAFATVDGISVPVITRAGGFGGEDALSELLWSTLH